VENVARVVLAIDEHDVAEEVIHFLDRTGGTRVVATAGDERQLAEAVRQLEPDAVVASPSLLRRGVPAGANAVLAVDTRESVGSLRAAIRAGARGFYVWPDERDELIAASRRAAVAGAAGASGVAPVVAVFGSRGGAGATFVATHLAAAFARRGRDCVLVDVDPAFDDVGAALSVPADEPVPTIEDLASTSAEAGGNHRPWTHPAGFRVIPGAVAPAWSAIEPADVVAAIDAVARASQVVVCHVPRAVTDLTRAVLARADDVLIVLTLEVASFRAAKRVVDALDLADGCRYVVNKSARADISVADVERVFGRPSFAVIPAAAAVRSAQDRGRLLPSRGRVARSIDRMAVDLLGEAA